MTIIFIYGIIIGVKCKHIPTKVVKGGVLECLEILFQLCFQRLLPKLVVILRQLVERVLHLAIQSLRAEGAHLW